MRIPWRELKLIGPGAERPLLSDFEVMKQLKYFQEHSRMDKKSKFSFLQHGLEHEDPRNPHTWGPKSPGQINWEFFDVMFEAAKAKEADERRRTRRAKAAPSPGGDDSIPDR